MIAAAPTVIAILLKGRVGPITIDVINGSKINPETNNRKAFRAFPKVMNIPPFSREYP